MRRTQSAETGGMELPDYRYNVKFSTPTSRPAVDGRLGSPSKADVEMMYGVEDYELTQMIGVLPFEELENVGKVFKKAHEDLVKAGAVKLVVGESFHKVDARKIPKQFANTFKMPKTVLPQDGKTHDAVVAELEAIAKELAASGKGIDSNTRFFQELSHIHFKARHDAMKKAQKDL